MCVWSIAVGEVNFKVEECNPNQISLVVEMSKVREREAMFVCIHCFRLSVILMFVWCVVTIIMMCFTVLCRTAARIFKLFKTYLYVRFIIIVQRN